MYSVYMDEASARIQLDNVRGYAHQRPPPIDGVYRMARIRRGISQSEAAKRFGITRQSWQYRERRKYVYWPRELVAIQRVFGFSDGEMMEMIAACNGDDL
jgi:hypothetical protein